MSTGQAAASTSNTLSKLGSNLRWQIEQCGVDPEAVDVFVIVKSHTAAKLLHKGFDRSFDKEVMSRSSTSPHQITVYGVRLHIAVNEKKQEPA